ncbi:hypothetical protein [Mucilaginibacter ginkgonis]|uniref:Carboxypeptidase-like protein n=1 Tax=Mucilaginibacter ginkgonis TaxID=2682091 RepID=A0A6I4I273_9SPHI|nr:hypothetical protein [Mucilaginibacter ginkgonis]QQL49386.1 hypothetical protein GO620_014610 [Mucilaginibacter ginkgonis]
MKRLSGIFILLMFFCLAVKAQSTERPLVQFSGLVVNADSSKVIVPYVNITNASYHNQLNMANYKGYFSFVAHEQDTIRFTSIGYEPVTVIIPANANSKSFTKQIAMIPQIIHLPVVRVFPWATTDEFRKDFLTLKIADDDLENARKNLSRSALAAAMSTLPRDAQEIQSFNAQQMHMSIVNQHSLQPNPLLNPIAWGTLIKQIADGDKSRNSN